MKSITYTPSLMQKGFSILSIILFSITALYTQDLYIYYDIQTEELTYLSKGGDTLQTPRVKKNGNIILHVTNFNDYIYEADITVASKDIPINRITSSPLAGIFSAMQKITLDSAKDVGGNLLFPVPSTTVANAIERVTIEVDTTNEFDEEESSGFVGGGRNVGENNASTQLIQLREQFAQELRQLSEVEVSIQDQQQRIDNILQRDKVRAIAANNIGKIITNPRIPSDRIKELVGQYIHTIFNENLEQLDLKNVIVASQPKRALNREIAILGKELTRYQQHLVAIENTQNAMVAMEEEGQAFKDLKRIVSQVYEKSDQYASLLEEDQQRLGQVVEAVGMEDFNQLSDLRLLAEEVASNDFTEIFRITALKDETEITIQITPKELSSTTAGENNSTSTLTETSKKQTAPLIIPTVGGLKMSASLGLGFGRLFNAPQSYELLNGEIVAQEEDSFSPTISSFFHFFPTGAGYLTFGGTFGIGIPLTDQGNGQTASFKLGPSMIIGREEQVVLTLGLMGGRTERLAKGLKVGQSFDLNSTAIPLSLPTTHPYELGCFIGLSFSFL